MQSHRILDPSGTQETNDKKGMSRQDMEELARTLEIAYHYDLVALGIDEKQRDEILRYLDKQLKAMRLADEAANSGPKLEARTPTGGYYVVSHKGRDQTVSAGEYSMRGMLGSHPIPAASVHYYPAANESKTESKPQPTQPASASRGESALQAPQGVAAASGGGAKPPILVDTDILARAFKGDSNALAVIRSGKTYVLDVNYSEFMRVDTDAQRIAQTEFLKKEAVERFDSARAAQLAKTEAYQAVYTRVKPLQGDADAQLVAYARATGYTAVTGDKRLANTVTSSKPMLQLGVPISVVPLSTRPARPQRVAPPQSPPAAPPRAQPPAVVPRRVVPLPLTPMRRK